ncbi:hypothetical protein ACFSTH_08135 [Paenibacillus yanchengensis]|uniref:Uncharacterized protein n=1 Tax=Paenibacillus yanchengensis TaxID=2035833 RepID=A0ABW4YLJ1_9BACL
MTYVPHPDKPGEINTIRKAIDELIECQSVGGGIDLIKLNSWLQLYPYQMLEAAEVLDSILDEHYPPGKLIETEQIA